MMNLARARISTGVCVSMILLAVGPARAQDRASVGQGAQTWVDNCDRCHQMRDPLDFSALQWRVIVSHMRIRAGLTGREARNVLRFLQQSSAPAPAAAARTSRADGSNESDASAPANLAASREEDGKRIYEGTCIACHGSDGKGAVAGAPDLTAGDGPLSKPDSVLLENIEMGFQSPGSSLAMPPKGGDPSLTEAEMRDVLQYLHEEFGS